MTKTIRYIDLFAGLGGTRIGLEQALRDNGLTGECVFTSEIKPHAVKVYTDNFPGETISGDITEIDTDDIPDFDFLLAGFPCQPFSSAGVRKGFMDTRGTLFFDIERILKAKRPQAFLLENVEGLVLHDRVDKSRPIGRTLETILAHLENLGYEVTWRVLDASEYGVPQRRKRIYIAGSYGARTNLDDLPKSQSTLGDILETKLPKSAYMHDSVLVQKLLEHYSVDQMRGKQIKDKRGGKNNIHSWDVELKGPVSEEQKTLLEELLKQRRRKSWALHKNIPWSDGMPLTLDEIMTFHTQTLHEHKLSDAKYREHLRSILDDLAAKGYLTYELPKKTTPDYQLKGYNIVVGKLSFEISNILDPSSCTPTLVATDVTRMAVADKGLRRLTVREGLRLFGFPEDYRIDGLSYTKTFDLLGNSVSVNAIKIVADRIVKAAF